MFVKLHRLARLPLLAALLSISTLSAFPRPLYAHMPAFEPVSEPAPAFKSALESAFEPVFKPAYEPTFNPMFEATFKPVFEPAISHASRAAADAPKAAVFGVKQEKVVKAVPLSSEWIRAVTEALESSPTAYGGFEVNPRSGIVIHFPFAEPLRIRNEKIPDAIRELYLFLEPGQKPRALLFLASSNKKPIFELNYDAEKLVRTLGLKEEWANNR